MATRPTWARASRCPSTTAPTISTSSRFPLHLPRNCLKVLFERFPSHCELDELCRRVAIAYQPGHWAAQAFDTAIPHLEETSWFMTWMEGYCVFIVRITLKPARGTGLGKNKMVLIRLPFILQGVFFNWCPPKNHKFFLVSKFWHLELFWWDLLCNLTLTTFRGALIKKTPCKLLGPQAWDIGTCWLFWDLFKTIIYVFEDLLHVLIQISFLLLNGKLF